MRQNLIFLHGGPGFKDYLQPYFHPLSDQFRCSFYNQLRGPDVTIERLVIQLLEQVKSRPGAVLVGHSWGAVLAIEFARRYENLVSGLVLMCAGLSTAQWHEYNTDIEKLGLSNASDADLFLVPGDLPGGKIVLDKMMVDFSGETFGSVYGSYIKTFDLTTTLSHLRIRIVNIFAEKDLRFPVRIPRSFRAINSRIEDHEIAGAGHFPFLQEPHRQQIHDILRRIGS
jgi:pimeloyl-ACP methyl ester carboxylesterase